MGRYAPILVRAVLYGFVLFLIYYWSGPGLNHFWAFGFASADLINQVSKL